MLQTLRNWALPSAPTRRASFNADDAFQQAIEESLRTHSAETALKIQKLADAASNQSLMKWRPAYIQSGIGGGLSNLGNSCFMNATLQCLAYLPPLTQTLGNASHTSQCDANGYCLLCECERFLPQMVFGNGSTLYPFSIYENLSQLNETLVSGQQQDAHEFLQTALVEMEKAIDRDNLSRPNGTHNLIRDVFQGCMQSSTRCDECNNITSRNEPFLCLSVDVADTLDESLIELAKSERMEGNNAYDCDVCQCKRDATRQTLLSHLPPVLTVQMKRFRTVFTDDGAVLTDKDRPHVLFPLEFDMNPKLVLGMSMERSSAAYELCGVIVHCGESASGGHYYADVASPDGRWFRMDDERVTAVVPVEVLSEEAYVLFYKRKDWVFPEVGGVDDGRDDEDEDDQDDGEDDFLADDSETSDSESDSEWQGIDESMDTPWVDGSWVV